MKIKIREATAKDFEAIYQFICALQHRKFDQEKLIELYLQNISNVADIYLIAEDFDKAVGYSSCHIQNLLHHAGKVAEIQEMFVVPEYRSRGVGNLLMNEIKRLAKNREALHLEVTTRKIRERAISFYLKEQFEDSHKKLIYYFNHD